MNKEILTVVEVVSNEKGVEREIIFQALESAIASATKKRFQEDIDCRVTIDREDGSYRAFRRWEIIDLGSYQIDDDLIASEEELDRVKADINNDLDFIANNFNFSRSRFSKYERSFEYLSNI